MKLGINQIKIFVLLGLSTTFFYYADKYITIGGGFSEGILVGFLLCLSLICSMSLIYIWLRMIYLNFKVRIKCKK